VEAGKPICQRRLIIQLAVYRHKFFEGLRLVARRFTVKYSLFTARNRIRQELQDDAVYSEEVRREQTTGQATVADEQTKKYLTLLELSKSDSLASRLVWTVP